MANRSSLFIVFYTLNRLCSLQLNLWYDFNSRFIWDFFQCRYSLILANTNLSLFNYIYSFMRFGKFISNNNKKKKLEMNLTLENKRRKLTYKLKKINNTFNLIKLN